MLAVRVSVYGLIALGFAVTPVLSGAACMPGAKPAYQDISGIYFRSEGVTAPVAIHRDNPVRVGACPVRVVLYVSPGDADMAGSPACLTNRSGQTQICCGTTNSTANDSAQVIFGRLVAVLQRDHFFDIAASQPKRSDGAAFFSIAVMRCGAQPHNKAFPIAFLGAPQRNLNTTILALSIPFDSLPRAAYDSKLITLFDHFTQAIYRSDWILQDIW